MVQNKYPGTKNSKRIMWSRSLVISLVVVILLVGGVLFLINRLHNHTHKDQLTGTTASEATKGEASQKTTPHHDSDSPAGGSSKGTYNNPASTNAELIAPTGNFVSSHHLSLTSGGNVLSTCNTTPGATCYIQFTRDGETRKLPAKTTDSGGATYWSWKADDSTPGLSAGNWQITAVATDGPHTLTTRDAMNLEITP